jgi:hypothetical protein
MNLQSKLFWDVIAVIVIVGMFAAPVIAARSWYVEAKRRFSLDEPRWRSELALAALTFASVSVLMSLGYFLRSVTHGGNFYSDPLLEKFLGGGLISAIAALPCALIGKGRARWPSLGIALLMSVLWFGAAMAV